VTQRQELALGRLLELVVLLNQDMTQSLATIDLTTSRTTVLWELRQRGPTKQNVLAEALKVSPRTMTGLIDGLVATGFVTREPHPKDRRATLVTLTAHGEATAGVMETDQAQFVEILFGGMGEARLTCLFDGLEEILARLRQHGLRLPEPTEAS